MTEKYFVNKLEKSYLSDGFYTKKEVGVGYGIADLVLFKPNLSNCLKRVEHNQLKPLMNEGYFRVFDLLPDVDSAEDPVELKDIEQQTHYSESFLKYKLLKDLKKAKYVKEVDEDHYFKINGWLPIGKELVAIEAKLKDWKRGFYQANRYRAFADQTYLAVPMQVANSVDDLLLKRHGVGLLGFDAESGERKIIIEAKKRKPLNEKKRDYASEYFWDLRLRKDLVA